LGVCGEKLNNALACLGCFLASISCFFFCSASRLLCSASWKKANGTVRIPEVECKFSARDEARLPLSERLHKKLENLPEKFQKPRHFHILHFGKRLFATALETSCSVLL
jgi:hypothetical protein